MNIILKEDLERKDLQCAILIINAHILPTKIELCLLFNNTVYTTLYYEAYTKQYIMC